MRLTHYECLREIDGVLRLVGPSAPLREIAKYFVRAGWEALGRDNRTFTKKEIKLVVPSALEDLPSDNGHEALVVLAQTPFAQSFAFLTQFAQMHSGTGTPALVIGAASSDEGEVFRTKETERVHGMYRITYSTQDLIRDIADYIKDKVLDAITPEDVSKFMDARDILNDPLSIIASKIPIHPHTATARGSYVVATKDMGDRSAFLGQFLHYRITTIMPHGSAKSFLVKNKTGEIVYAHSTVYVYGNTAQVKRHGPVFNDATLKAIWKENQDIYCNANYEPNYAPEN